MLFAIASEHSRLKGFLGESANLVHPFAGTERHASGSQDASGYGSPLRGQGTRIRELEAIEAHRFTPARAGNTAISMTWKNPTTVHPCAGREHIV